MVYKNVLAGFINEVKVIINRVVGFSNDGKSDAILMVYLCQLHVTARKPHISPPEKLAKGQRRL